MNVNDNERKVLAALNYNEDGTCFSGFAFLMEETGLDRKAVRRACRSLKRKGLAQFAIGLWNEDGEPRGSGYAATKEGAALTSGLDEMCAACGMAKREHMPGGARWGESSLCGVFIPRESVTNGERP